MLPKIGYLIDENAGWDDEDPVWVFYTEADVPEYKIKAVNRKSYKRIVYWEVEEDA